MYIKNRRIRSKQLHNGYSQPGQAKVSISLKIGV